MADAREEGPTGHGPINAGPGIPGTNPPGAGEVQPVKVDMGQGPPPAAARRPAPRPASASGGVMATSAVLALLFGGAGAWAYERFLAHPAGEKPPAASASQGEDATARKDLAGMEDRIKDLSDRYNNLADQYKQLQARVESTSKPSPAPELASIEQKVAQVDRLSQQVDAIGKRVDPLPQKLEQYDRRMTELGEKVDTLRKQETAARGRTPGDGGRDRQVTLTRVDRASSSNGSDRPAASTEAAQPSSPAGEGGETSPAPGEGAKGQASPSGEKGESTDTALGSGVSLFQNKRYADAYAAFRGLLQSHPDDARVWYYAALSYGLATGEWDRMTKTMVEEGVAREKAGKPAKAEIDSTFAGLTKESGKDWLAFYRRRAG